MLFKSTLFACGALTQVMVFPPSVFDAACRFCMPEPDLEPIVIEPSPINGGQQDMNGESGRTSRETIEFGDTSVPKSTVAIGGFGLLMFMLDGLGTSGATQ